MEKGGLIEPTKGRGGFAKPGGEEKGCKVGIQARGAGLFFPDYRALANPRCGTIEHKSADTTRGQAERQGFFCRGVAERLKLVQKMRDKARGCGCEARRSPLQLQLPLPQNRRKGDQAGRDRRFQPPDRPTPSSRTTSLEFSTRTPDCVAREETRTHRANDNISSFLSQSLLRSYKAAGEEWQRMWGINDKLDNNEFFSK